MLQLAPPPEPDRNTKRAALETLGELLSSKRAKAIQARVAAGIDARWAADLEAYEARDAMTRHSDNLMERVRVSGEYAQPQDSNPTQPRSTVHPQIVRQKTNAWAARVGKILFPMDTKNWAIAPTPVPELLDALKQASTAPWVEPVAPGAPPQPLQHPTEQRPLTVGDVASEQMADARRRASAMEREIEDQFVQCQYSSHARQVILDAAKVGVGILKGPVAENRIKKRWVAQKLPDGQVIRQLERSKNPMPGTTRVPFWDFFPDGDCGEDIHSGSHVFERDRLTRRKLLRYLDDPTYEAEQIDAAYKEGPQMPLPEGSAYRRYGPNGEMMAYNLDQFEQWIFTGDLERDHLIQAGADFVDPQGPMVVSVCVVMVNNHVIKLSPNLDEDGALPYDVFSWEPVEGCWAGIGIPRLMASEARTIVTAWRAMLDNAALCHAPMIILKKKMQPLDNNYTLYARKIFIAPDEGDVRDAFTIIDIPNHQGELQNIIQLAMKFADDGTAMPQIAQGERGSAPDTVGGMTLLMNAVNAVTERVVRIWDDKITVPHLTRYFDWNMAHNPKEEIKGDFSIWAKGTSALLLRDVQQQGLLQLLNLAAAPRFAAYADDEKIWKAVVKNFQLDPDEVTRSAEDIARIKNQPQQPEPSPQEKVAQIRAQAQLKAAEMSGQNMARAQTIEAESEQANIQLRMQENEQKAQDRREELEMQRQLAILKYANERAITLEQVQADLAKTAIQTNTQKELAAASATARRNDTIPENDA